MENIQLINNDVLLQTGEGIAIITLNRPDAYNGITTDMKRALIEALNKCSREVEVKAIVLTGEGRGFSAGADLAGFMGDITPLDVRDDLNGTYNVIVKMITEMDKPIIAAINGTFAGAGIGFALACDLKYMSADAKMRYAFINIALVPDAGSSWFLVKAVGYTKAFEIITGGEKIAAAECLSMGIINKTMSQEEVLPTAIAQAKKMAQGPTKAYAQSKKLIRYAMTHGLSDTMAMEAELQANVILGHDNMEGARAFLEKRAPKFIGE